MRSECSFQAADVAETHEMRGIGGAVPSLQRIDRDP